ncbi:MAG: DMT family transporter [Pseudomonadota bacterium]
MTAHAASPGGFQKQAPLQGVLWMVVAAFFFAVSVGLVRHISENIDAFSQTFWRQLIGLLIILPFVFRNGISGLRTHQLKTNLLRNMAGYSGIALSFYSVTLIPLAESLALQFTLPLFTIIFAIVILGERVGVHRWVATVTGFLGALIILRPGVVVIELGMIVALVAAALLALSDVLARQLSRTETTLMIVFYGYLLQTPMALAVAIPQWDTPTAEDWPWLIALGLCSFAAQWGLSRAFVLAEASLVSPILFLRLPIVSVIGYVFFAQVPDIWTWVGALVIFASTYYAARREALHQRQLKAAETETRDK